MPFLAAVVAAPILKLWPLYASSLTPPALKQLITAVTRQARESVDNGPGAGPLCSKKAVIAVTGQIEDAVFPRNRSTPLQKGSVLLALM